MFNSLVLSPLNYGILLWDVTGERIFNLQKIGIKSDITQ